MTSPFTHWGHLSLGKWHFSIALHKSCTGVTPNLHQMISMIIPYYQLSICRWCLVKPGWGSIDSIPSRICEGIILTKIHIALIWKMIIRSDHNFACVTTAELLWHVEICDLIGSLESTHWIIKIIIKTNMIYMRFQLWAHKPFVKRVPAFNCHQGSHFNPRGSVKQGQSTLDDRGLNWLPVW